MQNCFINDIIINEDRTREEFAPTPMEELYNSIKDNGLLSPIIIDVDEENAATLVAGERRLRTVRRIYEEGLPLYHAGEEIERWYIPVIAHTNLTDLQKLTIEVEENLRRQDLTWQERVKALARLAALKPDDQPVAVFHKEVAEVTKTTPHTAGKVVARAVVIAQHMDNPKVHKAKTENEAWTALQQDLSSTFTNALRDKVITDYQQPLIGEAFSHHTFKHAAFEDAWEDLDKDYSLVVADPPYGIDADSMSRQVTARHYYDDSEETALSTATFMLEKCFLLLQDPGALFMFCAPNLWHKLYDIADKVGYSLWHRPLIWHKSREGLAPWGNKGFTYTYEMILFATKGRRGLLDGHQDVIDIYRSQRNKLHGAQKPVALYELLMRHAALPGEKVLDPCCGSGTVFPAAANSGLIATGIERDPTYATISRERMINLNDEPTEEDEL